MVNVSVNRTGPPPNDQPEQPPPNLPAMRALAHAATPGPWVAASDNRRRDGIALVGALAKRGTGEPIAVLAGDPLQRHHDAEFIAYARNHVGGLLDLAERLLESAQRLDRITAWHARESGPCGTFGDYCTECGSLWPCDTRRMAEGTYTDEEPCDL